MNSDDGKRFQSLHFNTCPRSPQDLVRVRPHLNVAYTTYSVSHRIPSNSRWRRLPQRLKTRDVPSYISLSSRLHGMLAMATLHANVRSRPTEEFLNRHETPGMRPDPA